MSKKQTLLYIAIAVLAFTAMLGTTALAGSTDNFVVRQTYTEGIFSDIEPTDWFYNDVISIYEYGFITGEGNSLFNPQQEMSLASIIALACRIRAAYDQETAPQNGQDIWYSTYVEYALAKGIILPGEFTERYNENATRAEAAHILANTLPESELTAINNILALPDVPSNFVYFDDILALYNAGILTGSDNNSNFYPSENIKRTDVIVLTSRLIDAQKRKTTEIETPAVIQSKLISDNFTIKNIYADGVFTDISSADWYYDDIVRVYEYGLASGMGANLFMPQNEISVASVIALACRINACYFDKTPPQNGDNVWYLPYIEYAIGAGIITADDFSGSYTENATRAEVAYILYNALPQEAFSAINSVTYIPDTDSDNKYYEAILALYNSGIVTGKNDYGDFYPDITINRAEVMTMLRRIIEIDIRKNVVTAVPSTDEEIKAEIFRLINLYRAQAGLSALQSFDTLNQAAQTRATEIADKRDHIRPDGTNFYTVLNELSIGYFSTAENIACGQATPIQVMTDWLNSEEHKKYILHPDFNYAGIGYYKTSYGMTCWTQLFIAQ